MKAPFDKPRFGTDQNTGQPTLTIPMPHYGYVNGFLRKNCYEELSELFKHAYNHAKELTESYAALKHMRSVSEMNDSITTMHIGDGASCLTAATFAFLTKTDNIVVEPNINMQRVINWMNKWSVQRLELNKCKIEDFPMTLAPCHLVMVHSHAPILNVMNTCPNWIVAYTNPCCMPEHQTISEQFMIANDIVCIRDVSDFGILSDKRNVVMYLNIPNARTFYDRLDKRLKTIVNEYIQEKRQRI